MWKRAETILPFSCCPLVFSDNCNAIRDSQTAAKRNSQKSGSFWEPRNDSRDRGILITRVASEGFPNLVKSYLTTFVDIQGGHCDTANITRNHPPNSPQNGYAEKINNFIPKGPKPQKHVSEAIVVEPSWGCLHGSVLSLGDRIGNSFPGGRKAVVPLSRRMTNVHQQRTNMGQCCSLRSLLFVSALFERWSTCFLTTNH